MHEVLNSKPSSRLLMRSSALRRRYPRFHEGLPGGGGEDAPVVLVKTDAHDAPVGPDLAAGALTTRCAPGALQVIHRSRAPVLERVARCVESPERQVAPLAGLGAPAPQLSLLGVHDVVRAFAVQGPGDGPRGVEAGHRLFFAPQLARLDERAHLVGVPQLRLQWPAIQPPVGTEVPAPASQLASPRTPPRPSPRGP